MIGGRAVTNISSTQSTFGDDSGRTMDQVRHKTCVVVEQRHAPASGHRGMVVGASARLRRRRGPAASIGILLVMLLVGTTVVTVATPDSTGPWARQLSSAPGVACIANADCTSPVQCLPLGAGGFCCASGASAQCFACNTGTGKCGQCAAGYYASVTTPPVTCTACTSAVVAGMYCAPGSTTASPGTTCPIGSYCLGTANPATLCPAGTYGSTTGRTTSACTGPCTSAVVAGMYCAPGSTTASPGTTCPIGSYCLGTANPATLCPAGTYGSTTGLTAATCTGQCPAGTYGSTTGLNTSACSGPCTCAPGNYCPLGSTSASSCTTCPAGSYCLGAGNGTLPCPAGTYGSAPGLTTSACTSLCPAGCAHQTRLHTLCVCA